VLQITASGFQTTIRGDRKSSFAEWQSNEAFGIGRYKLAPGFLRKNGTGKPDVVLFHNAAALVKVSIGADVSVRVDYLSSDGTHVYKYSSSAARSTASVSASSTRNQSVRPAQEVLGSE
jgi:hypothetical protein